MQGGDREAAFVNKTLAINYITLASNEKGSPTKCENTKLF